MSDCIELTDPTTGMRVTWCRVQEDGLVVPAFTATPGVPVVAPTVQITPLPAVIAATPAATPTPTPTRTPNPS